MTIDKEDNKENLNPAALLWSQKQKAEELKAEELVRQIREIEQAPERGADGKPIQKKK